MASKPEAVGARRLLGSKKSDRRIRRDAKRALKRARRRAEKRNPDCGARFTKGWAD